MAQALSNAQAQARAIREFQPPVLQQRQQCGGSITRQPVEAVEDGEASRTCRAHERCILPVGRAVWARGTPLQ